VKTQCQYGIKCLRYYSLQKQKKTKIEDEAMVAMTYRTASLSQEEGKIEEGTVAGMKQNDEEVIQDDTMVGGGSFEGTEMTKRTPEGKGSGEC